MARFGKTAGAAATYILLASLQRGMSLLILPFITHAMSPSEYGAASMLTAGSLLLTALVAAPLVQIIIRSAARREEDGPALLRAAGTYCYFIMPGAGVLAAVGVALLVPAALGVPGSIWAIELLAIGFQPATSVFALWVAQAREDFTKFAKLSLTSIVVTAASKLVLVVILNLGVFGWALADLISAALSAVISIWLVRLPRAAISPDHIRYIWRFSLPLIPHSASFWALASLSRPAMAAVSTLDQVGILSFGLSLAQVAGLILGEINRSVLPRYSREMLQAPTSETLGPVRWQLVSAFIIPAAVGLGVAVTGRWLFAEAFWQSFLLTGVLLVGQAAYGLYFIPMNYLTQTAGLPRYGALSSGAGAILVFVWILALGHRYGAIGVAYATTAGYFVMAAVAAALAGKYLDIAWRTWLVNWPEVILAAGSLAFGVAALAVPLGSSLSWNFAGLCLALGLGASLVTVRSSRRSQG